MNLLGFIMSLVYMQAVHGWLSTYERLVNSQKIFSPYLTQEDLSRLGRNYIEVGRLTEEFFPNHDIRLVAVSDNIDTDEGENELAPIRNLFNEWYARDISKKRRISNKIKGNAGEPMGQPPYGYGKYPENPKRWIVDEEAAQVVRRIYRMTLEGGGTEQIAAKLEEDGILTPRAYWLNRPGKVKDLPPTHWNSSSVIKMLSVQEYCGDILNFKTYSKSYKNKKRLENDRENWAIFKDVHEPIIERAVFEQVQQKRGKMRKRQAKDGERSMFSGLLVCADCGSNLHFHFNQGNPEIKYFNCSNYKGNRGTCGSTHYVRVDFLEQVVLGEIRRLTKYAGLYEDDFLKEVIGHSRQAEETERRLKEKELKSLLARDDELDGLFERIYEDNVSGKLSDDRFAKMSRRYEEEQKELSEKKSSVPRSRSRAAAQPQRICSCPSSANTPAPESSRRGCSTNWWRKSRSTMPRRSTANGYSGFASTITASERLRFQRCCPCRSRKCP